MRKTNRTLPGFSLVELIVLIAVMAVLVGMTSLGIGMIRATDTKKTAYGIEDGLTALKAHDMAGKETVYMHLFVHNGKYYRTITNSKTAPVYSGNEKEIGGSMISISVTYDVRDDAGGALPDRVVSLEDGAVEGVCIGMSKKDGSFLYQKVSGTTKSEAPREIKVTAPRATDYEVYMVTDTGKHYVEAQ